MEAAKINISAKEKLVFGFDLHSWEQFMLWSLGTAALAAVAVVVTTASVVILTRDENSRTKAEFEAYKIEARKQTAELEKATADAQLELFKLRMPRSIDMEKFNELIAHVPPAPVEVLFDANSPDAASLASRIWGFLFNAKWHMESGYGATPLAAPPSNILPWSHLPWTQAAGASPWGVTVLIGGTIDEAYKSESWRGLFNALAKSIDGQVSANAPAQGVGLKQGVLRVVVGPKHP